MKKMTHPDPVSVSHLHDALYCQEEQWETEEEGWCDAVEETVSGFESDRITLDPLLPPEEGPFREEDDLPRLIAMEQEADGGLLPSSDLQAGRFLSGARREAVEWMLRAQAHYAFAAPTAVLCVNYLDRFLSAVHDQRNNPWMPQLAAVTCLSLAAKVEETQVPLLLDLQVEQPKFVFEAKTIQRMELLVLSTLNWKMNPATPLSYIERIAARLGLKTHSQREFLRRCGRHILSVIADPRYMCYPPSSFAAAAILLVIQQMELANPLAWEKQLLDVLKICKEKVKICFQMMAGSVAAPESGRNLKCISLPGTPSGVLDMSFSGDSSNDSWPASSFSSHSSPLHPLPKKRRSEK